ncbi:MAG: DNA primase [Oligoflexales bacterium]
MPGIEDVKNRILGKAPLETLVGEFVNLTKKAGRYTACCPFHAEKTASFYLYDDHYHCFGCGAHGDVISFVQSQQGLGFIDALKWLANKFSIPVPELERSSRDFSEWKKHAKLGKILLEAQDYFVANLSAPNGQAARDYLLNRGFAKESWAKIGFGYAADSSQDLISKLQNHGYEMSELEAVSLASVFQGRSYDFFRHRLTIPIRDTHGRLIAFGGRALGQQQQKYKNSRYDKSATLFAMDLARKEMRNKLRGIVVEGYLDALKMHEYGYGETVACQGTALTREHMRSMNSATSMVYLLFDGDQAGRNASLKLVSDSLDYPELQFKVALLPMGEDPDSYLRAHGREALDEVFAKAQGLIDFAITQRLQESHSGAIPNLINKEFVPWLSSIRDPIQRSFLLEKVSRLTGVESRLINAAVAGKEWKEEKFVEENESPSDKKLLEGEGQNTSKDPLSMPAAPLANLAFEFFGHIYYARPDEQIDLELIEKFLENSLEVDELWLFFAKEMISCLRKGLSSFEQDQAYWVSSQASQVIELTSKLKQLKLAFKLKNRKKMLERLMLLDRQNKIKNTITSIKDSMVVAQSGSAEGNGEWKRLGQHFLQAHQELRRVQKELESTK